MTPCFPTLFLVTVWTVCTILFHTTGYGSTRVYDAPGLKCLPIVPVVFALKIALLFIYFLFVDVFLVVFLIFFCFVCCCCYFFSFFTYPRINYLKLLCTILVTARARPAWGPGLFCKSPLQTKFIWYLYVCISILIPINFNKIFITLETRYPSSMCPHFAALSLLGTFRGRVNSYPNKLNVGAYTIYKTKNLCTEAFWLMWFKKQEYQPNFK